MSVDCGLPPHGVGVALRLSSYLDCQAQALGENGFQALIGGPIVGGLVGGLVTLFVALIGYRLLVGERIGVRDGLGWTIRLGMVLALVTGWPAFQTLIYRVATVAPTELAQVLLPAAGLPSDDLGQRVQYAYDTIRLGGGGAPVPAAQPTNATQPTDGAALPAANPTPTGLGGGQPQQPAMAMLFVVSTVGLTAALRIAVGFLLAVGPLPILGLLFEASAGLFTGWVAALAGAAFAVLGTTLVTALELVMLESEIADVQAYSRGMVLARVDPQALAVLIIFFALAAVAVTLLAVRITASLRPFRTTRVLVEHAERGVAGAADVTSHGRTEAIAGSGSRQAAGDGAPSRAAALAGSLAHVVQREQAAAAVMAVGGGATVTLQSGGSGPASGASPAERQPAGFGASARRPPVRQSRRAAARDRVR